MPDPPDIAPVASLDLGAIVRRSRTLHERLAAFRDGETPQVPSERSEGVAPADAYFARWEQAVSADGTAEGLDRRLEWSGWSRDGVRRALAEGESADAEDGLPDWADLAGELSRATVEHFGRGEEKRSKLFSPEGTPIDPGMPLPFEELLLPSVALAGRKLEQRAGRAFLSRCVSEEAVGGLLRHLLSQLSQISESVLFAEFEKGRPFGRNLLFRMGNGVAETGGRRTLYDAFVESHGTSGWAELWHAYPMLARFLATRMEQWIVNGAEFFERLEADWEGLGRWLGWAASGSVRVERLQSGFSDSHHGGKSVIGLRFSDGRKLIYKPRGLGLDVAFRSWAGESLRTPDVLEREGYGWVEFIEAEPLASSSGVERFYRQAGMLLFHVYLAGGTDCHLENVIATRDGLVLIDGETLLHAEVDLGEGEHPGENMADMSHSVLSTGLLPNWRLTGKGSVAYDDSGLGSSAAGLPESRQNKRVWMDCSTDAMRLERVSSDAVESLAAGNNDAVMDGAPLNPADYIGAIVEGFSEAYEEVLGREERASGLSVFQECWTRFVFRSTEIYFQILRRGFEPEQMRDGLAWGLNLELVTRAAVVGGEKPDWWPLIESELEQMTCLDVPYFRVRTDGSHIVDTPDGACRIPAESGLKMALDRRRQMAEGRKRFQVQLIQSAFAARNPSGAMVRAASPSRGSVTGWSGAGEQGFDAFCREEAHAMACELEERVLRDGGSLSWLGFRYLPRPNRVQLDLVGQGIYDGVSGIALFLSAVDASRGEERFSVLWREALRPFRRLGEEPAVGEKTLAWRRMDGGIASGIGGLLYAAATMCRWVEAGDREWLLCSARAAAGLMDVERLRAGEMDGDLDLLGGAAGAVIGLLALYRQCGESEFLDQARAWGDLLREAYGAQLERGQGPPGMAAQPLTGLSHGASGMALALARLSAATGDRELAAFIDEVLAHEDGTFDAEAGNWPDFRLDAPARFMATWCHGGPGIALARSEIAAELGAFGEGKRETGWERGIATLVEAGDRGVDHLCCGNLGQVEILWQTGREQGREDYVELAREWAEKTCGAARERGAYRFFVGGGTDRVFNPGLFQGVAGVGYQLLRLADPENHPSVLAFRI